MNTVILMLLVTSLAMEVNCFTLSLSVLATSIHRLFLLTMVVILSVRVTKIRGCYLVLPRSQPRRYVANVVLYVAVQLIGLTTSRWKSYYYDRCYERLTIVIRS